MKTTKFAELADMITTSDLPEDIKGLIISFMGEAYKAGMSDGQEVFNHVLKAAFDPGERPPPSGPNMLGNVIRLRARPRTTRRK